MVGNRRRNTKPELVVRSLIHRAGLRYRVDFAPLGGRRKADIVFSGPRIAVFIDGCFWHSCPVHGTTPVSNSDYWGPKLARNVARDHDTDQQLVAAGWTVVRIWEHVSPAEAAAMIIAAVRAARAS
jgi:DNA mismatch endonuclease (patch repair protein)